MAAVFLPFAFHHEVSGRRHPGAAQARIVLAIAVSACVHAWLAAGIVVEAPQRSPSFPARVLTALLEETAVPAAAETQPEPEPAAAEAGEPRPYTAHRRPLPEPHPRAAKRGAPDAPHGTLAAGAVPPSASALPSAADPTYYSARELDVYPAPQAPLRFEYPERAAREQVGGGVRIMLLLDETGTVDGVSVVAAEPPGYFEDRVRAVFAAARFFPASKDGRAVKSRVLVQVDFEMRAAEGTLR